MKSGGCYARLFVSRNGLADAPLFVCKNAKVHFETLHLYTPGPESLPLQSLYRFITPLNSLCNCVAIIFYSLKMKV